MCVLAKGTSGGGDLGQLSVQLRLALGKERSGGCHRRLVPRLRLVLGCLCAGEELFDVPALLDFLFELRLELRLPLGGLFRGHESFA